MNIRAYRKRDATQITELFHESVHAISDELYTSNEKEAWAPTPPDYEIWENRLEKKRPVVGLLDNRIVGFIELEIDGHIDCFYVHNKYQNCGIGSSLLKKVIQVAKKNELSSLYTEASIVAEPIFKKFGFVHQRRNEIELNGQILINFSMIFSFKR
jgi:putative acetyltransferase